MASESSASGTVAPIGPGSAELVAVRRLLTAYAGWLGPDGCFEDAAREMADLPGPYAPPSGALWLASDETGAVGCAAMRRLDRDRAELKRLSVEPAARGRGHGRRLVLAAIDRARLLGCEGLLLDTLVARMPEAVALYRSLGFREMPPGAADHPPAATSFGLQLQPLAGRAPPQISRRSGSRCPEQSG